MGRANGWPFDQHKLTQYKFYSKELQNFLNERKSENRGRCTKPTGNKHLQLSICVRLAVRKGKLISSTYPSESKAHFPV